jgi:hypothetical protein
MKHPEGQTATILRKNRKLAETGIFLALFLGMAYTFSYIPNVEFITLIAFLAGLLLQWKRGLFVAVIGEAVFSIANPFGSSLAFPTLLIAQLLAFATIALAGAFSRLFIPGLITKKPLLTALILGLEGFLLTLLYNIVTSISFALPSGFGPEQTIAMIVSGIPFYFINMLTNTISFAFLITLVLHYVQEHYPHYFKEIS